jgi:hypothetical protein
MNYQQQDTTNIQRAAQRRQDETMQALEDRSVIQYWEGYMRGYEDCGQGVSPEMTYEFAKLWDQQ